MPKMRRWIAEISTPLHKLLSVIGIFDNKPTDRIISFRNFQVRFRRAIIKDEDCR